MHRFRYMALGGFLMFIGMLTASVLMPSVVAQRDKFGDIECTGLKVVDARGVARVVLSPYHPDPPVDDIGAKGTAVFIGNGLYGGRIYIFNYVGDKKVTVGAWEHGGAVEIFSKNGNRKSLE